ncbi:MAG: hypothetical protein ABI697_07100 [Devosia sp.]
MKRPNATSAQAEHQALEDAKSIALCDRTLEKAAAMMLDDFKVPAGMAIDRLATYALAWMLQDGGKAKTAAFFRDVAGRIDQGEFDELVKPQVRH